MTPAQHSRLIPTSILAFISGAMVVAFYQGHLNDQWVLWLAAFLVMELTAVVLREPGGTFSERVWAWSGINPPRPLRWLRGVPVVLFLVVLIVHLATGGQSWYSGGLAIGGAALPLAAMIGVALWEERSPRA